MEFLITILPFVFGVLAGFFNALMDSRLDYGFKDYSIPLKYFYRKGEDYLKWYEGGNHLYPAGNPFEADYWHWCKHMMLFCNSGAVLSAVLATLLYPSHWLILYGFYYGVHGITFTFFYSYALRSDRHFRWYLHHLLRTWKTHKPQ